MEKMQWEKNEHACIVWNNGYLKSVVETSRTYILNRWTYIEGHVLFVQFVRILIEIRRVRLFVPIEIAREKKRRKFQSKLILQSITYQWYNLSFGFDNVFVLNWNFMMIFFCRFLPLSPVFQYGIQYSLDWHYQNAEWK